MKNVENKDEKKTEKMTKLKHIEKTETKK